MTTSKRKIAIIIASVVSLLVLVQIVLLVISSNTTNSNTIINANINGEEEEKIVVPRKIIKEGTNTTATNEKRLLPQLLPTTNITPPFAAAAASTNVDINGEEEADSFSRKITDGTTNETTTTNEKETLLIPQLLSTANISSPSASTTAVSASDVIVVPSWCDQVKTARESLNNDMVITYQCEGIQPPVATSAIVCMLTAGVDKPVERKKRLVFTSNQYVDGIIALGYSLQNHIDKSQTHMLLLIREGFELPSSNVSALHKVGWTIGVAPNFPLKKKYIPKFPRYKTTYTKVSAIGLSEYKCVLLMDADTLVIGDIRELLTCNKFTKPYQRVAGTLDYFRKSWMYFNSGSILWKTSNEEMNRVYNVSKNESFMEQFTGDQDFLNKVYPDRLDRKLNKRIVEEGIDNVVEAWNGPVVPLGFEYNAQTHVEVVNTEYWKQHRNDVRILHYTQKKAWQCPELYDEKPSPTLDDGMPTSTNCDKSIPICYCREGYLYWNALKQAKEFIRRANKTIELLQQGQ